MKYTPQNKQAKKEILYEDIFFAANKAGLKAAEEAVPTPMIVSQHENPLDDNSPVKKQWYVGEGACGFAWVVVKPGTHSFAKWLTKTARGRNNYYGGIAIWCPLQTQSIARKEAWANAFVSAIKEIMPITVYADSRLD